MKFVSSLSYKIKLFENSKSSGFIEVISSYNNIFTEYIISGSFKALLY